MEFHQDSFDLPEGATALIQGDVCQQQCFKVGRASYGFQFHLEVDSAIVSSWIRKFRNGEIDAYKEDAAQYGEEYFRKMVEKLPATLARSEAYCVQVAQRWLELTCSGR